MSCLINKIQKCSFSQKNFCKRIEEEIFFKIHIPNILNPKYPTFQTPHIPIIPPPELLISQKFHIPNFPHFKHPAFQTSHIPNTLQPEHPIPERSTSCTYHVPNILHPKNSTPQAFHIPKIPLYEHSTSKTNDYSVIIVFIWLLQCKSNFIVHFIKSFNLISIPLLNKFLFNVFAKVFLVNNKL